MRTKKNLGDIALKRQETFQNKLTPKLQREFHLTLNAILDWYIAVLTKVQVPARKSK